ncbi:MAG: hypothetical protein H0X11_09170 [Betaproteobacteria bacterium]|nr:hypothetical protein [Betaproteobacteria bacterium]
MSDSERYRRADRSGHTIRPGRPTVRTTFQLCARLGGGSGACLTDTWNQALKICVDWLGRKFPERIPPEAYKGESIELEVHGQSLGCIGIPELGLWSARIQLPDAPFQDAPAIAGRSWTTEIALSRDDFAIQFAARNVCASLPNGDAPIAFTTPVIVTDLADNLGLIEMRPLDGKPWILKTEADLEELHAFLENAQRSLPVYLISETDPSRRGPDPTSDYLLDSAGLARRTLGLAHVVVMPGHLASVWTQRVGKEWSAEMGAVRTYRPGLRFDDHSPYAHPAVLPEKILSWRLDDLEGAAAMSAHFVEMAYITCVGKKMHWGTSLFYADARAKQAELRRAAAADDENWRASYEAQISALKAKLEESIKESEAYNDDAIQAVRECDLHKEESARLRMHNDSLRAALSAKIGQAADATLEIPDSYDALPEWAERNLVGRLVLHPRAKRGLRGADYEDRELVYRALLLLANEFRAMRRGDPSAKEQLEAGIHQLGLHLARSIAPARAGQQGDEYFAKYPLGSDKNAFFELHLRKGSSKKTQYCLAIYFFWDEATQQVVIGWLPSHLDNRMT